MKKVFSLLTAASLLVAPTALAAPQAVKVQLGSIYSAPSGSEGALLSGKNMLFYKNVNDGNSDIHLTAFDMSNTEVWQRIIDSGVDEVATAATIDPLGNIWLAGSAALPAIPESVTSIAGIDNPDSVSIDSASKLRSDMNQLALWKISNTGELLATYLAPQKSLPIITAISATNSGISIIGSIESRPFLLSATTSGTFGKILYIGSAKSELTVVSRGSDGSSSIFGSSAETIAGKKVAGIRDGLLIKVSKTGTITSVVRSSAQRASRSWISGDALNLLSGPVVTGKVVESAITKFNSTFAPMWTLRVPSTGASATLSANGNSYLALTSRSQITGVSNWKPTSPSLLVLTFDGKGSLKAATALPGLVTPISLHYSSARGVTGLASASDGSVSIFTLVSR